MKKLLISIAVVVALGILYYGISPLFNVQEVDEEAPEAVTSGVENLTPEEKAEMDRRMEEANATEQSEMEEVLPEAVEETLVSYPIMHTTAHPASGSVRVIETTEGTVIRFEDFETINGPQLHLYLSKDLKANDYIDLGPIKGTRGNINYLVPEGVDLSEYRYVMHWCVPFSVLFNYADLGI